MANRIMLLQADLETGRALGKYLKKRGDRVWLTNEVQHACEFIRQEKPDIVLVDLHLPEADWIAALNCLHEVQLTKGVIVSNRTPDLRRELMAKERGVRVFLRYPFTPEWIEKALERLEKGDQAISLPETAQEGLPRVRVSMRVKITLPYVILALLFAVASSYLVSRYVLESIRDRFYSQLVDAGKLTADWMVQEEDRLLNTLRLIANTDGVADALAKGDSNRLRQLVLPLAINAGEQAVELIALDGSSGLSMYHMPDGDPSEYDTFQGYTLLAGQDFVNYVLQGHVDPVGDKYAAIAESGRGTYFYVSGPIKSDTGGLVGVVLVGKSLSRLSEQIRRDTLAHTSFYDFEGRLLGSTLFMADQAQNLAVDQVGKVLLWQDETSIIRQLEVASSQYSEVLGPWEARNGSDIGVVGIALAENYLTRPTTLTRVQVFGVVLLGVLGVVVLGVLLARQITRPLSNIVQAAIEVAKGNLEVKVDSRGSDEVTVLAHAFNHMISGLQEGFIYRDLLGRTVSPQVREALRHSFASGDLRLEGQTAIATVLISDIQGFTTLSETEEPTTILTWLNEYFSEIVPIIAAHDGVVDKFEGDAMLAVFGILPQPLSPEESAYQACLAGVELLKVIAVINERRKKRAERPLITGIGIHTGPVTAGSLGTADRLNYTVIGNTVNTTQRLEGISRSFGQSGVVISENTLAAIGERRSEFNLVPLGEHAFKGKRELIWLYRLIPDEQPGEQGPP